MAKWLAVLVGTLAVLILAVGPLDAIAQGTQYGGEEVSATGYLTPVSPPGAYSHLLNDEATGQQFFVRSDSVDLGAYDDGQKVTVRGTTVSGGSPGPVLEVTSVEEPAPTEQPGQSATLSFELSVTGEPPADATFFGNIQTGEGGPGIFVPLTDPEGDGVYTGSTTIEDRFPPGLRPLPPDAEPLSFPVRILQGTGTNPNAEVEAPGEPTVVVRDFGVTPMQQSNSFPATVSFGPATGEEHEDGGDPEGGVDLNEDGVVDEADAELAAETSDMAAETSSGETTLPNTGGPVLPLGVGAILAGAGLLVCRSAR